MTCSCQKPAADDLPGDLTEAESSLAMFRSVLGLHPFHGAMIVHEHMVLLSAPDDTLLGQTTLESLMNVGAQA